MTTQRTPAEQEQIHPLAQAAVVITAVALVAIVGAVVFQAGGSSGRRSTTSSQAPRQAAQSDVAPAAMTAGSLESPQRRQAATALGDTDQQAARNEVAEYLRDHTARQTAASNLPARPMGGYAEWLLWRSEAATPDAE